jgi:hypothetical protein
MSAVPPFDDVSPPGPAPASGPRRKLPSWLNSWLKEPLLHFMILGGLLFAADHAVNGRAGDPRTIVIDATVDKEVLEIFKAARGRAPNEEELYGLRRVWLDNEVLYREGLMLQMDKGDKAIRDRVIFKALSMVNADLKLPPIDDAALRAWFEKHRVRYDEPARYDFQEAVLAGEATESAARAFASTLQSGAPGDTQASLRVFKGRPHANLVTSYGETFAKALETLPPGEWRALPHERSFRVVRLEAVTPPKPADFESLRGIVLQDWKESSMAEQRAVAVRAMARKYKIEIAPVARP